MMCCGVSGTGEWFLMVMSIPVESRCGTAPPLAQMWMKVASLDVVDTDASPIGRDPGVKNVPVSTLRVRCLLTECVPSNTPTAMRMPSVLVTVYAVYLNPRVLLRSHCWFEIILLSLSSSIGSSGLKIDTGT